MSVWPRTSRRFGLYGLLASLLAGMPGLASAHPVAFNLPAQEARTGAALFARQAGIQLLITEKDAKGRRFRSVRGPFEVEKALALMLKGSHLHPVRITPGVYSLVADADPHIATMSAGAPEGGSRSEPTEIVVVTGSRLRHPNQSSASPIVSLDQQELRYEGVLNLEEALNRMPQIRADSTQFANASDTDGRAKVNLRNLGWQRTLVLVDGQRFLPVQAIDLNLIPSSLVKRIDVLTGGASATYGSDAIAGVVNLVLDPSFDGVTVGGSIGAYQHTNDDAAVRSAIAQYPAIKVPEKEIVDGLRSDVSLSAGRPFAEGRGHVSFFVGSRQQQAVNWSARDYSACRLVTTDNKLDCAVNTVYSPYGRYVVDSGDMAGSTWYGAKDGGGTFVPGSESAAYAYNTRETFAFQRPDQRTSGGLFIQYRVSDATEYYASLLAVDDRTRSLFYPALVRQTVALNCDNPFMTVAQSQSLCGAAASTNATVATDIAYELNGPGSQLLDNKATNADWRIAFGAKGDLSGSWHYDLGFVGSRVYTSLSDNNEIDPDKFARALQVVDIAGTPTCMSKLDGTDPDCVPANIFGYHTIDPAFYDYAYVHYRWASVTQQQVYSASLTGDLTPYGVRSPWADTGASVAVGVEYRRDSLRNVSDAATRAYEGWLATVSGHNGVKEAYVELQLPVIKDRPGVYSLDLNLAYRTSLYDNQPKAMPTSRFEIQYRPRADLLIRASVNQASRAPNISELYAPAYFSTNSALVDACAGTTPSATLAQCLNTGISAAQYGHVEDCATTCRTYGGGGNAEVKPEAAETITFGMVFTPNTYSGLVLSVDYYRITVADFIDYVDATTAFNRCLTTGLSEYCGLVHRDVTTGALAGDGYVEGVTENTYRLYNNGVDVQGSYPFDLGRFGKLESSFLGTWLATSAFSHAEGDARVNCAGYFGSPYCYTPQPRWRHNARVTWRISQSQASLSLNWRYIGSTLYAGNSSDPAINGGATRSSVFAKVPAYTYIDLSGGLMLRNNLSVRLAINNLLDLTPPITSSLNVDGTTNNPNTWTGTYDALGRSIMLSFDLKL